MLQARELLTNIEGLSWVATELHQEEARSTWRAIASFGARLFGRALASDDAIEAQHNAAQIWIAAFRRSGILLHTSELLLSLGGHAGGGSWERVRVTDPLALLRINSPEPEFVAMSIAKTNFVAVTTEESEQLIFYGERSGLSWELFSADGAVGNLNGG